MANIPAAPRAGTPTAETTKPAGTIAGEMVGSPPSTTARVSPVKMTRAANTNSGAIQPGTPACHSHTPMPTAPTRKPSSAPRKDMISPESSIDRPNPTALSHTVFRCSRPNHRLEATSTISAPVP